MSWFAVLTLGPWTLLAGGVGCYYLGRDLGRTLAKWLGLR